MKNQGNNSEILEHILDQLKNQSVLLQHLASEITQLKQVLVLSRNSVRDATSIAQSGFNTTDTLLSLDRPIQKIPNIVDNNQDLNISSFPVNIEKIKSNIKESNKDLLVNFWNKSQDLLNEIMEAKENKNYKFFIPAIFELYLNVFKIFNIIMGNEKPIEFGDNPSLTDIANKVGPVPAILDFDLLDFVSEKMQNKDFKIGEKTAEKIFDKLENSLNSIVELLNLVL